MKNIYSFKLAALVCLFVSTLAIASCTNQSSNITPIVVTKLVEVPLITEVAVTIPVTIPVEAYQITQSATQTAQVTATVSETLVATSPTFDPSPPRPIDCPGMTQSDMNFCAAEGAYTSARRLDKIMSLLLGLFVESDNCQGDSFCQGLQKRSLEGRNLLLQSHNHWEAYKLIQCDLEAHFYESGSIQPLIYFGCLNFYNLARVEQIFSLYCNSDFIIDLCDELEELVQ